MRTGRSLWSGEASSERAVYSEENGELSIWDYVHQAKDGEVKETIFKAEKPRAFV